MLCKNKLSVKLIVVSLHKHDFIRGNDILKKTSGIFVSFIGKLFNLFRFAILPYR